MFSVFKNSVVKESKIEIDESVTVEDGKTTEPMDVNEMDRLIDGTTDQDVETLIETQCTIAAESGVTVGALNIDVPHTKLPDKCEKIEANFLSTAFGSVTTIKSMGRKQTINARTVLWYFSFVGFAINYMLRVNINIAITEMIISASTATHSTINSECVADSFVNETISNGTSALINAIATQPIELSWEQNLLGYFGVSADTVTAMQKRRHIWFNWILISRFF